MAGVVGGDEAFQEVQQTPALLLQRPERGFCPCRWKVWSRFVSRRLCPGVGVGDCHTIPVNSIFKAGKAGFLSLSVALRRLAQLPLLLRTCATRWYPEDQCSPNWYPHLMPQVCDVQGGNSFCGRNRPGVDQHYRAQQPSPRAKFWARPGY